MALLGLFSLLFKIASTAVVAQCLYYRYLHPLSRYPGPFLASFSNLWKFIVFLEGRHHLVEQKLHEEYGHVVRTGPTSLSFSSLAGFDAIYGFNKAFEKGDFYRFGDEVGGMVNVFTARSDDRHREHRRKVVGPAFSSAKVGTYEPIIRKNVSVLTSRLRTLLKGGNVVNVAELIHRYTFDTMLEIIYGDSVCPQPWTETKASAGALAGFRDMSKMAWATAFIPWLSWLFGTRLMMSLIRRPSFDAQRNLTGISAIADRARNMILVKPEQALKSSQSSIVKNYLLVPEDNSSHMSPDEIWRESFNLTFAGPGSTAAALTSVLYCLGTPEGREWQVKICDEQISTAEPRPSATFIPPHLTAIIKETLRLYAPFPTAFTRVITPGAESAIPDLPAPLPVGTTVSSHTYILGHSSEIWGLDVETWNPERWLPDSASVNGSETEDEKKRALDDKFFVFGKGSRRCIGRDIAMLVVARAVAEVVGFWDLRSVGPLKGRSWLEMQYEECVIEFLARQKAE